MRLLRVISAVTIMLMVSMGRARAEGFITPFIGYNFSGDSANCVSLTNCEDKRTNFGVSIGAMGRIIGFEEDISYAKDFFGKIPGSDNSVFTAMSNLMVGVGVGHVQPYFLGGFGLIRPHASINPLNLTLDKNAFGYDIGGGINGMFTRHVGIRGDVRHFHTLEDVTLFSFTGDKLDFWRGSVGLTLKW